jgi:hypothetical protein
MTLLLIKSTPALFMPFIDSLKGDPNFVEGLFSARSSGTRLVANNTEAEEEDDDDRTIAGEKEVTWPWRIAATKMKRLICIIGISDG